MNEKKNNKSYVVMQCLGMVVIGGLSYWIGRNTENDKWNQALNIMARTGVTMNSIVDGKDFICSVTEK